MDKKIKTLFEYQKFANNKKLANVIANTLNTSECTELRDDMLAAVAGGLTQEQDDKKKEELYK